MATLPRPILAPLALVIAAVPAQAALPAQRAGVDFARFAPSSSRVRTVPARIDDQARVTLRETAPAATRNLAPEGFVDGTHPMEQMILSLKMSPEAQLRLNALSVAQQDPTSPYFHRWLTPEQFGALFGASQADLDAVATWLMGQGFTVDGIANGRLAITFSGTAAQVQQAFRTTMKTYRVGGVLRQANATDLSLPEALSGLVSGVVSLTNIPRKAMNTGFRPAPEELRAPAKGSNPSYTSSSTGKHYVAPGDFATIYNLKPLYNAGIDGTGTTIAIVGRSNIVLSDIAAFRSNFGLPANQPTVVLNGADPGTSDSGELGEAMLDAEWSGAVAKGATIKFVVTKSTSTTDGVDASAQYIVDHANTLGATVMSTSFGSCESDMGTAENTFYTNLWQQAATEGVTSFVSAGDAGAAGCNGGSDSTGSGAAVSGLASTPYNVCVGGTEFNDGGLSSSYWAATNDADKSSAVSFIPEMAWNESNGTTDPAGNAGDGLWSTGGGVSMIYAKPSWQVATGVPADGKRDCPDVSLTASSYDGYLVVQGGSTYVVGGTSASSPAFAGIMALIVQKNGLRGQGNANPRLYELGKAQYGSGGTAVFHDTTVGNNTVPGVTGFTTGTGYDLATGLGSVDATALVNAWSGGVTLTPGAATVSKGARFTFAATSSLTPNTVTWSATGGTITANTAGDGSDPATYVAPATITGMSQDFVVTATGSDGTTKSTATVTVYDPAQVTLSAMTPGTDQVIFLEKATTQAFTAATTFGSVDWTASSGTITATTPGDNTTQAMLTLPTSPADVTVTATAEANHSQTQSITVHVRSLDVNGDGVVDVRDLLALSGAYGTTSTLATDLSGQGGPVNDADLTAFLSNF
ncbi:MAG: hypothetical protein JST24_00495 [Acidobacteria bacterium]|nr:hypothetical protein [Acidobacteriota bacterium]